MTWFFIAIIAPLLWSIANHVDKYLLSKHATRSSVGSLMIFSTFAGALVLLIVPFFADSIFNLPLRDACILIIAGFLAAISITFYLSALKREEATIVVPLMQLIPLFGCLFSFIILGETLSHIQLIAFVIIIAGAFILSLEFIEEEQLRIKTSVLLLMTGCSVFFALYETLFKFVALDIGFAQSTFWEHCGILLYGIILFSFYPKYRNEFKLVLTRKRKRFEIISINVIAEILTLIGNVVTNYALLLAPVALIQLTSAYQPVFAFIIGVLLTLFLPHISTEKIGAKHLVHKTLSIAVILFGSYLLLI